MHRPMPKEGRMAPAKKAVKKVAKKAVKKVAKKTVKKVAKKTTARKVAAKKMSGRAGCC